MTEQDIAINEDTEKRNLTQAEKDSFDVKIFPDERSHMTDWKELWGYRVMIKQLVKRDLLASYRQTVMGAFWPIAQPIVATLIMGIIFGNLAGLSPEGVPVFLFYLSGQFMWIYFSNCVSTTANTFINNAPLMKQVYFPKLVFPIDGVITHGITLLIHIMLFILMYIAYVVGGATVRPNIEILLVPFYLLQLTILALGAGSILASMTTKYKDIALMFNYGLLIWMYISPIVYDINIVPDEYLWLYMLNPIAPIAVQMRHALFSLGESHWLSYLVSVVVTLIIFIIGNRRFNKAGKSFVDTI